MEVNQYAKYEMTDQNLSKNLDMIFSNKSNNDQRNLQDKQE